MFFLKLCRNDYIRTMYLLLNKNLLTNLVMLRCMLWGVGLLRPIISSNLDNLRFMMWEWVW